MLGPARERLARRRARPERIQTRSVEVDTDVGTLLLPEYDLVILPWLREYGTWEPEVADALRRRLAPGMTVVDLGAHVGYHTLVASRAVGASGWVFALEPEPTNFALLLANLERGQATNVRPMRAAAWDESGPVRLARSADNSGDHRVVRRRGPRDTVWVRAFALDDLLRPEQPVHLVKSDLQGADHRGVRGMARCIERDAPLILAEFWPEGITALGDDPLLVLASYRRIGYGIDVLEMPGTTADAAILEATRVLEGGFCTLMLEPESRP